jgi:hypothetical protein
MKRLFGIAFLFVLGAQVAQGGGIGGLGGGGAGLTIRFDPLTLRVWVPGRLDERFEVMPRGYHSDSELTTYSMEPEDFARLQDVLDSRQVIQVRGEGGTRSYRAVSGEQLQQVELIDRRAAIRSEVR